MTAERLVETSAPHTSGESDIWGWQIGPVMDGT